MVILGTVYADGVELANNQNSNSWWFHPGQLSFGGWENLGGFQLPGC